MNKELIAAIEQLEREKGIAKDTLLETIEAALITAYKKNFPYSSNARVAIDKETGEVKVFTCISVVDSYSDEKDEILLEDAQDIDPNYRVGDVIEEEVTPQNFGRIAAQTAKQVVVQRIREAERNVIYNEFSNRESEIITGTVQRQNRGTVFINLGRTEAVLLASEQMPREQYRQGDRLKLYILEVKQTNKGPQVTVSRSHPGLVKRLFELEVPEIYDGIVEIKSIAREAGSRTKLSVYAADENLDAVGACVGQRGVRVQTIVEELYGEKIDIVNWSKDPKVYISNALSPSSVEEVYILDDARSAMAVVPDHQLSLAIGKEGQNARLAAKLTGWKIDIKSRSQFDELPNIDEIIALDQQHYDGAMAVEEESIAQAEVAEPAAAETAQAEREAVASAADVAETELPEVDMADFEEVDMADFEEVDATELAEVDMTEFEEVDATEFEEIDIADFEVVDEAEREE